MPLEELYLENTMVRDVGPLKGMPLKILRMELCSVSDISPLAGMPLQQLNLFGTKVEQIEATGAKLVVVPCHSCNDQLKKSLKKEYRLDDLEVKYLWEVVADAIVIE